jgi:glycosyltransferase involved in cell wall biosynthesis
MKVALIHDWLTGMRGGEKALEALCELFPGAPIYTLVHVRGSVSEKIESHQIHTSYLQRFPMVRKYYRNYLPLFPNAIEKLKVGNYDLIISSSHCAAKGILPAPSALHICYCYTPMRYIWSHYNDYFGDHRAGFVTRTLLPHVRDYLCSWDLSTNRRVDQFVAISKTVAERIRRFYGRESMVIYPPVDVNFFSPDDSIAREPFFLIVSALVPYKRIDMAIESFNHMQRPLLIVGTGPEYRALKKIAQPNVSFLGRVDATELRRLYRTATALVQSGEEDFGINIVEALASGCPVIAYGKGGALETVTEGESGLFFNDLTAGALAAAVDKIGSIRFNKSLMRATATRFSSERFKGEIQKLIQDRAASFTTHVFTQR